MKWPLEIRTQPIAFRLRLWHKLYRQLPRFALDLPTRASVVMATVIPCLLYGCEVRTFTAAQLRRYQTFVNRIVFGLLGQRRMTMSEDHVTLADLRARLGWDTVSVWIRQRKLQFLAHVARAPQPNLAALALTAWLVPDSWTKCKGKKTLRSEYKSLLMGVRPYVQAEVQGEAVTAAATRWQSEWMEVAGRCGGMLWAQGVRAWLRQQRAIDSELCWERNHAPGGLLDQRHQRAVARNEAMMSAVYLEASDSYSCSHCGYVAKRRSMLKHVLPCSRLPQHLRERAKQQREQRISRMVASSSTTFSGALSSSAQVGGRVEPSAVVPRAASSSQSVQAWNRVSCQVRGVESELTSPLRKGRVRADGRIELESTDVEQVWWRCGHAGCDF
eukprot:3019839-Amphidinium_carterae.3